MWKGPRIDGVTQSMINKFLQCPYCFYIYAILGLQEEQELGDNLIWGDSFHKGLEILLATQDKKQAVQGMKAYLGEEYNRMDFAPSLGKMLMLYSMKRHMAGEWIAEEIIDEQVAINGILYRIRGKRDGINRNHDDYGQLLAEHKCKGYIDPVQTKEELSQDIQVNLYMYLDGTEWVAYDLIKIPDVQKYGPAPSPGETKKDWAHRIYNGPVGSYNNSYPIYKYSHKWVHQGLHFLPRESQERYWEQTIRPIIRRMDEWFEYVTDSSFDIENPDSYGPLFYRMPVRHFDGRKTEKFKCDYHALLTGQLELSELSPIDSHFSELEEK